MHACSLAHEDRAPTGCCPGYPSVLGRAHQAVPVLPERVWQRYPMTQVRDSELNLGYACVCQMLTGPLRKLFAPLWSKDGQGRQVYPRPLPRTIRESSRASYSANPPPRPRPGACQAGMIRARWITPARPLASTLCSPSASLYILWLHS